ncbi:DUF551 domain-containing protein [Escherichia coli]|uniref:DUF551 domain-containing protein n=2 Tax=Escherichia coli TaxID=562 RepID=UPI00122E9AB2|nr:DUF551 domain-containing protein [Escherichia coli]KAA1863585.1 DUF551 domain-containing protein [Escherichia coli]HAK9428834.1 DUF551 domain-containing protein [Escherichia coli]HDD8386768.1 DUF551 domain-containing protein [Escherichia coli]HEP0484873.1 DUF551 domain-containing protein [Escherichia coli]
MNTLTKEWLQNTITSIESARDEIPFGLDEDQNDMLTALKIALASLAAVSDERAAYELFMEKRFGESVDRRRAKNGDREYMAWDMALGWIIWCHRAAMLQGSQPVSQTYNLPQTHFEQVADLYEMQFDDGRTCAFHTDAQKAAQWLRACDGNRVQEYVKLERLQNALSGNSPVIPDGWISCSERMPDDGQHVIILCDGAFVLYAQYRDGEFFDIVRNGDEFFETQSRNVTDWMPLPEPPQEVK